ncbi:acyl-CoA N-acyltransferase [Boeremia exigua]|uniref:acyl-CoA N-acyltransferase n=1 Tax=Boeremia exigua TaxID=749465 RepID=UPI001E8D900C|nr:acyl-CoA N-acyltransferase [Boeremia exigua]KAH6621732.1 acyl-CoA N-acyltransferase [Boeremia exigua]
MPHTIEPYNAQWPSQYEHIIRDLTRALPNNTDIVFTHIGSTAIPQLPSRPIIDILLTAPASLIATLWAALEPNYTPSPAHPPSHGIAFTPTSPEHAHTLYLCASTSLAAHTHLAVRAALTSTPSLRTAYAALKHTARDAATYAAQKQDFLGSLAPATAAPHYFHPVTTSRLTLREYVPDDVDAVFELESCAENARFQSWAPWTREGARGTVVWEMQRGFAEERDVVDVAVVCEGEGGFVGRVGGKVGDAETGRVEMGFDAPARAHIDLWYSFLPRAQGKGLATEAVRALIAAFTERERTNNTTTLEFEIECDPRNTASWRLAERLGFSKHSLTERAWECKGEWVGSLVYRMVDDSV